jgi:hypothetical protein
MANHCDENPEFRTEINRVTISKLKGFLLFLLCGKYNCDLLGCHRQNRKFDTIEFVETTPRSRLNQACTIKLSIRNKFKKKIKLYIGRSLTFVDSTQTSVIHLI